MTWGTPYSQRQGAPKIDLLPRQLVEQRQTLRQRSGIGAGFLVLLAVLGIWYAMESRQHNQAREQADQERAVATGLRARRAQLQPLADLESQIAAADQLRASVYKREVRFSSVMRDISAIVPDDIWLTSMAVAFAGDSSSGATGQSGSTTSQSGQGAAAVTPGSPGAGSPIATITFAGSGLEHVDVGGFLRALARGPKKGGHQVYLNPYFTTSQKADENGQETVTFSASVDLSSAAYSRRFQPAGGTVTP